MTDTACDSSSGAHGELAGTADPGRARFRAFEHILARIASHARPLQCVHCGAASPRRWGTGGRGLQRWRCRVCERTFSAATGTPFARLHSIDKLQLVLADMAADVPSSCRRLARLLAVDAMTVWRWRKLIMTLLERSQPPPAGARLIATRTLRESRKASREWVDHRRAPHRFMEPDRLRWIDYRLRHLPLPKPLSPYCVPIALLGDVTCPTYAVVGRRGMDERAVRLAALDGVSRCAAGEDPGTDAGGLRAMSDGITDDDTRPTPFERFLQPFCGPATKHLAGYAAWFGRRQVDRHVAVGEA
jgi:transposase-like protein